MILDFAKAENEVCDILGGHDPNWEHDRLLAEALERQAQAAVQAERERWAEVGRMVGFVVEKWKNVPSNLGRYEPEEDTLDVLEDALSDLAATPIPEAP